MKSSKISKINGITRGINLYQVGTYILISSKLFLISYVVIPHIRTIFKIIFSSLYYSSTLGMIVCGWLMTVNDPTDLVVLQEKQSKLDGTPFESEKYSFYCENCEASVSDNSKHCKRCNRCVKDFDHHCVWINNCVAKKNHLLFVILLTFVGLSTIFFSLSCGLYIGDYYSRHIDIINENNDFYNDNREEIKVVILIVFSAIAFILFMMDIKLLSYHLYLIKNNITTYQHIVKKRERNNDIERMRSNSAIKRKIVPEELANLSYPDNAEKKTPEQKKKKQIQKSNIKLKKLTNRSISPSKVRIGQIFEKEKLMVNRDIGTNEFDIDPNALTRSISMETTKHLQNGDLVGTFKGAPSLKALEIIPKNKEIEQKNNISSQSGEEKKENRDSIEEQKSPDDIKDETADNFNSKDYAYTEEDAITFEDKPNEDNFENQSEGNKIFNFPGLIAEGHEMNIQEDWELQSSTTPMRRRASSQKITFE